MRTRIHFLICAVIILSYSLLAQNQQWPMVNAGKERTSWASLETVLHPPLQEAAVYTIKSSYHNIDGMTLYNGLLCISLDVDPNTLEVQDVQTGDTLWTFKAPETGGSNDHTAAQNDSLVFFGGQHGVGLHVLDRQTGQEKWLKPYVTLYARNVMLDENRAYFVGDSLYCLDTADGSTVWAYPFMTTATPAIDDEHVYVCGSSKGPCIQ